MTTKGAPPVSKKSESISSTKTTDATHEID